MNSPFAVLALLSTVTSFAAEHQIVATVGFQENIDLGYEVCSNLSECAKVGNGSLIQVQYSAANRQLILFPKAKGETSLTVRDVKGRVADVYKIYVGDVDYPRIAKEIAEHLKGISRLSVKTVPGSVIVDGRLNSFADLRRVNRVLSTDLYRGKVTNLVRPAEGLLKSAAEEIGNELRHSGAKVRVFGEAFIVEGVVKDEATARNSIELARSLAQALMPWITRDPVIQKLRIAPQSEAKR